LPKQKYSISFSGFVNTFPLLHFLSANAIILPGETNTTDNTFIDGFILVTIAGDVTGEGVCDMQDISILVDKFLKTPKDREWDPNCDINDDLSIDVADISIAINHFLEGS